MTNLNLSRPEPLADFLDRGGDPQEHLGADHFRRLVEQAPEHAIMADRQRARWAHFNRQHVEASLFGEPLELHGPGEHREAIDPIQDQGELDVKAWTADLLDDFAVLGPRLLAFADPAFAARTVHHLHMVAHPHPLGIEMQSEGASCSSCGDDFPDGALAMTIGHQHDADGSQWSEEIDGAWCFACVTIVLEAMKAARG